ncbi:hypothetical protein PQX77_004316 [Marasmius sp. AFHP31]|nr:hypothetical protein PQX77_004316 [Marasmius sp. AFHP31]
MPLALSCAFHKVHLPSKSRHLRTPDLRVDILPILKAPPDLLAPRGTKANEMHARHSSQYLPYLESPCDDLLNPSTGERRPGNLVQESRVKTTCEHEQKLAKGLVLRDTSSRAKG